jgi:hypothetical protein
VWARLTETPSVHGSALCFPAACDQAIAEASSKPLVVMAEIIDSVRAMTLRMVCSFKVDPSQPSVPLLPGRHMVVTKLCCKCEKVG